MDGRLVTRLRTPVHRIPAELVPRGTHRVTVRLHADDGTVWAVDGEPVEGTADITASGAETTAAPKATQSAAALSAPGARLRTGGRASPDRAGKAS
ncbi:putative Secreted protein [Streptomyces viridochromogenes Tue57]|uniref:Putative Secreted protein n=1 Tax=Streptomyces viridochromogenes Tue57 TaxID=1160705 RepID=L8P9M9_STRVR|nr:putative Secreted protein [Streptomyces viridochromogenes Tue57]